MSSETEEEGKKREATSAWGRTERTCFGWVSYGLDALFHCLVYYSSRSTAGGSSLYYRWNT